MRYLLDTDTCIEVLRRREPVFGRVRALSPDDLAISAMTVAELHFGALKSSDPRARSGGGRGVPVGTARHSRV